MHFVAKAKSFHYSRYKSEKIASFVPESDGWVQEMDWKVNTKTSLTVMLRKGLLIRLDDGSSVCCKINNSDPKEIAEQFEGLDDMVNNHERELARFLCKYPFAKNIPACKVLHSTLVSRLAKYSKN